MHVSARLIAYVLSVRRRIHIQRILISLLFVCRTPVQGSKPSAILLTFPAVFSFIWLSLTKALLLVGARSDLCGIASRQIPAIVEHHISIRLRANAKFLTCTSLLAAARNNGLSPALQQVPSARTFDHKKLMTDDDIEKSRTDRCYRQGGGSARKCRRRDFASVEHQIDAEMLQARINEPAARVQETQRRMLVRCCMKLCQSSPSTDAFVVWQGNSAKVAACQAMIDSCKVEACCKISWRGGG